MSDAAGRSAALARLGAGAAALGVPLAAAQREALLCLLDELAHWNRAYNLTAIDDRAQMLTHHLLDSLAAQPALAGTRVLDLGTGAGFPGLVIALLQDQSDSEMHLIESDTRKAAFLREVSRETAAKAIVHNARAEDVLDDIRPDVITSRAMSELSVLIDRARPFVEKGAVGVFLKGRDIASELTRASIPSNFLVTVEASRIDAESAIVRVTRS